MYQANLDAQRDCGGDEHMDWGAVSKGRQQGLGHSQSDACLAAACGKTC
jgi:hypothetical protein